MSGPAAPAAAESPGVLARAVHALRAPDGAAGPAARHALRMSVGAAAAFLLYRLLGLPQGYWAVFTVVIVVQASTGATLAAALERLQGTLLGALVGGAAATLRPGGEAGHTLALAAAVALTSFAAVRRPSLRVAPVTAVIMLISPSGSGEGPLVTAAYRVAEIALGSAVGVAATFLILPARSRALLAESGAAALELMAEALSGYADGLGGGADGADPLRSHDLDQGRIRAALARVEAYLAEAERERTTGLGAHRFSRAFPRTLWRVRNDEISVSRALGPWPETVAPALLEPTRRLMREEAALMRRAAEALRAEGRVDRGAAAEVLRAFEAALADMRRSRATHPLDLDAVGRLFGLAFALESLHRNLEDLADRIDEAAATPGAV